MKKILCIFLIVLVLQLNTSYASDVLIITKSITEQENISTTIQLPEITLDDVEIEIMCKMLWGEARGLSEVEQRAAVEVALNMVDMRKSTIIKTITPDRFTGYNPKLAKSKWSKFISLVEDELYNYYLSKALNTDNWDNYRVIPKNYCYWMGDGHTNYYCDVYHYGNLEIAKEHAWSFTD